MRHGRWAALALAIVLPACGTGSGGTGGGAFSPVAVFIADGEADGVDALYTVDAAGTRIRLSTPTSGLLPSRVRGFEWSPDRSWVAFTSDRESPGWVQLYVVPSTGGEPRRISPDDAPLQDPAFRWAWSPDGARVAFQGRRSAGPGAHGWLELYVWTLGAPGTGIRVSAPMALDADVEFFAWSPDGRRLAYMANPAADAVYKLFTVRADGSEHVQVSGSHVLWNPRPWSSDGGHLAWTSHDGGFQKQFLHAARADGAGATKLAEHPFGNNPIRFAWAPDIPRLVYENPEDAWTGVDVFTVAPDGTDKARLSPEKSDAFGARWSPDGERLSFLRLGGLWVCGPRGENPVNAGPTFAEWSPDGGRLAYLRELAGVQHLFVVRRSGLELTNLTFTLAADRDVSGFLWSPGGSRVAWLADADTNDVFELYAAAPDGSGRVKVSAAGPVAAYQWTSDGGSLLYLAGDLYLDARNLTDTLPAFAEIGAFQAR